MQFHIALAAFLVTLFQIPTCFSKDQQYKDCGQTFDCGTINVGYPFSGAKRPSYCGYPGFSLTCQGGNTALLPFPPITYQVLATDNVAKVLTVARTDLINTNICPGVNLSNDTFSSNILKYSSGDRNITLYFACTSLSGVFQPNEFPCTDKNGTATSSYFSNTDAPGSFNASAISCNRTIVIRIDQGPNIGTIELLISAIGKGFGLQWEANNTICDTCSNSGGRCGYNSDSRSFVCFCSDKPHDLTCNNSSKNDKTWIWILVSVSSWLIFVLVSFLFYMRIRKRKLKEKERRIRDGYIQQLAASNNVNYGDELERGIPGASDVKIFSLGAILAATDNFSNENKLGEGGFGPVYKGKLFDGREIAIKRLSKTSGQGVEQFKSELILISKLQHTNLVRLYGCCIHQGEKMLIYEFMPNKSLDYFLFVEDERKKIDWQMRFNIIEGIAQGMLYLHKYSRMKVIHRDLKVSNVLLDGNMNPKIADFGLAKIFQPNVTEGKTYRVAGTYGYMAPEYAMQGTFSIKSDVFSFGVLILEIISGKKNSSFYDLDRSLDLVGYAWELWRKGAALELKDEALGESCDIKQLLRSIHVGLLCVQENAYDRPTMSEVIFMLNNEIADLSIPKQPAFFTQPVEVRSPTSTEHF